MHIDYTISNVQYHIWCGIVSFLTVYLLLHIFFSNRVTSAAYCIFNSAYGVT